MEAQRKTVVVLPTLNDNATVLNVVESMLADPAADAVWVVDGGSIDGTRETVQAFLAASPRLRLIDNPGRTEAHALNLAASLGEGQGYDTLVRVTAQGIYPRGFVTDLVTSLDQSEAASVVVPVTAARPASDSAWSMAGADLYRSGLARVESALSYGMQNGPAHPGLHAAFDLAVFNVLRGYDTNFSACEDIDFDMRLVRAGHRIWFASGLTVQVLPRANPQAFLRQMMVTGRWRLICARKYRQGLAWRQLLPLAAVTGSVASLLAAVVAGPQYALVAILYCTLIVCMALSVRGQSGVIHGLRIGWLALVGHVGFSLGLLSGCLIRPLTPQPVAA